MAGGILGALLGVVAVSADTLGVAEARFAADRAGLIAAEVSAIHVPTSPGIDPALESRMREHLGEMALLASALETRLDERRSFEQLRPLFRDLVKAHHRAHQLSVERGVPIAGASLATLDQLIGELGASLGR